MRILITGGAGFIATELAFALLRKRTLRNADNVERDIQEAILFDLAVPRNAITDSRVKYVVGELLEGSKIAGLVADVDTIVHLAAVVSGQAEADLGLGLSVNLDGTRVLLDAAGASGRRSKFLFASSCAVFGGSVGLHVMDETIPAPESSYGTQKLCCEYLVADYHRRGLIDGRSMRFPTVAIRPGAPNAANSSFISSIVREPVDGKVAICPVGPDVPIALISPARLVEAILIVHDVTSGAIGWPRTLTFPAVQVTARSMLDALRAQRGSAITDLVRFEVNERIEAMVRSWPASIESKRARALGIEPDSGADAIVSQYLDSYNDAKAIQP